MKTKYLALLLLTIFISCNKYDGPSSEILMSISFSKTGDEQKTLAGNYFNDSISVFVSGYEYGNSVSGLSAILTVEKGGGSVHQSNLDIVNGYASTKWKSGTISCDQRLRVDIYSKNNTLINQLYFHGNAFRTGIWDTITSQPDVLIMDILADTSSHKTFMINSNGLFRQKDNYFNWEQYYIGQISPFRLFMDGNGFIYLSTWNGQIYKSIDGGNFWSLCQSPIEGHPYYYYMTVSNDGYLWASTPEYPKSLRCSRDGGLTWTADTAGLNEDELVGDIYRLNTGELLFHTKSTTLYKSTDDGKSWKPEPVPEYSIKLYVTDKEEIIIINQDNGITIYKSTDLGQTYKKVYNVLPEYGTTMEKSILKKGDYYYILIPGYGIIRTPDFDNFETFWRNTEIVYLYLTYDGVIICKGFDNDVVYYYRD